MVASVFYKPKKINEWEQKNKNKDLCFPIFAGSDLQRIKGYKEKDKKNLGEQKDL